MSSDDPLASAFSAYGDPLGSFLAPQLENAKLPIADQALEAAGRYREAFTSAFGTPEVTVARIAEAIADYCHTIRSGTSAYDRFAAGDTTALSPEARRGLDLFQGKAGCAQCHTMAGERATFTDDQFHDTGVTWSGQHAKDDVQRLELADRADLGAADVTGRVKARRAFRTPTLRDVARRGPFMHDGSLRTLAAVVRHYDRGTTDPLADPRLPKMDLDNLEAAALVEFLRALTSEERPGLASTAWRERAPSTRLRFVDATGAALADLQVKLIAAGDRLPGIDPNDLDGWKARTDEAGWISYEPPLSTHVRVVLPDGLRAETGALVPDTCREAVIAVPVHGRVHLLVTLPAGVAAPPTIVAVHVDAQVFPDRRRPRTVFRPEGMTKAGDKLVALYGAPERTDVPPRVLLHLPVRAWGMDQLHLTLDPARTTRLDLSK